MFRTILSVNDENKVVSVIQTLLNKSKEVEGKIKLNLSLIQQMTNY